MVNWDYGIMKERLKMIHKMRLQKEPFELIKQEKKTMELRLYDEKRSLIQPGDRIEFTNLASNEILNTKVIALHRYESFDELYRHFDKKILGYLESEEANFKDMELYYSKEEQEKYGVVGIEIQLIK